MSLPDLLLSVLNKPSLDALWQMQPHLLALDAPGAADAHTIAGEFYAYLSMVRSKMTSKDFSALASALAAGSVGVIALEGAMEGIMANPRLALFNLFSGGLASFLEISSTVQHVRAWETEFTAVHEDALWRLYGGLWRISAQMQPDLVPDERHVLIDRLLAPARHDDASNAHRLVLIVRLYQLLLAIQLAPILPQPDESPAEGV